VWEVVLVEEVVWEVSAQTQNQVLFGAEQRTVVVLSELVVVGVFSEDVEVLELVVVDSAFV